MTIEEFTKKSALRAYVYSQCITCRYFHDYDVRCMICDDENDMHEKRKGEPMVIVPYGQDPYSVIGKYIRDHITAIEDIIAVIEIEGVTTNQLFMVDMNEENYFIWNNDWYEGEKHVALIEFFPVSEAINPSAQPEIIYCKDCIHAIEDALCGGYWCKGKAVTSNHYCGYAERRTDD